MTLSKQSEGIYFDDSSIDELNNIDSVIFDCDGVLIDITKSYDSSNHSNNSICFRRILQKLMMQLMLTLK